MLPSADVFRRLRRILSAAVVVAVMSASMGGVIAVVSSGLSPGKAGADITTNNGDNARDGWYPNEPNLSPTNITSGNFGQLFSTQLVGAVYGQPLVDNGVLVVTTEADWIYGLDPASGAILWSRNVGTAFNEGSQEGCGDLTLSGITATPVVDPSTGIVYFTDKQYISGNTGDSQYWLHAINPQTGGEEPNFPVLFQGTADNDPTQSFNSYYQDQRPGLLLLGGVVYAGFGSVCDYGTYHGWVIGISTAGTITTRWSDEAGQGQTAEGGIWQSGMGIMSDGPGTMVVITSNGDTPPSPTPGTSPPNALGQSVVRLNAQSNGQLKPADFFTPTNAQQLSTIDADFGSGGAVELPPVTFSTSKYPEILAAIGKEGYMYLLNAHNLGGFGQGASGGNADIARIGPIGGVWGKTAVWPGDGGYAYVVSASTGGGPGALQALAWSTDANGNPTMSHVGSSSDAFGYGSGSPAVTSNGTASGSATLWTVWSAGSGGSAQLRAYNPVPVSGTMQQLWSAPIGVASKFLTPDFDNGRVYVGNINGQIFGFGAPVPQPLSVSPTSFPITAVGSSTTQTLTISTTAAVTVTGISSGNADFTVGTPSATLPASVPAGGSITVPVTFTPSKALPDAAVLTITMSGGALSQQAIGLSGTGQYPTGHPLLTPPTIDFGNVALNSSAQSESAVLSNNGAMPLTITGAVLPSAPYSVTTVPATGTTIAAGGSIGIPVTFTPDVVGNSLSAFTVDTSGGNVTLNLTGGTGYPPSLEVGPQTVDFGSVTLGTTEVRTFTITNTGSTAAAVTLSKPPVTSAGFAAVSALPEDTTIAAGASLTETVSFTPPTTGAATDQWIIDSTDGLGKRVVTFVGTGVSPPQPAVSVNSINTYWPLSGTGKANFTVSLSWPASTAVTVTANTADSTATVAAGDYQAVVNQTVTIPAGSTSATVPVTINANGSKHSTAIAFSLNLSNPVGAFAGTMTGQGNIVFGGSAVNEFMTATSTMVDQSLTTAQTAEVPVTLGPTDYYAANCIVNTADGTAKAANGAYVPIVSGVVIFKAHQSTNTIPVTIPAATAPTGNETFTVSLTDCNTGAVAAGPVATVTIIGAAGKSPSVETSPGTVDFGSVPVGVTETRSVTFTNTGGSTATITSSAPPSAGQGFTATTSLPAGATIAPGASLTETVAFHPSAQAALSDTWTINANDGLGARTVTLLGTGIGPLAPTVSVNWINLVRPTTGTATATFTLSLSSPSPTPLSVTVRTLDGTATVANGDYVPITKQVVTFAPGQTTATVPVTVNGKVATHSYFGFQIKPPYTGVLVPNNYGRANLLGTTDKPHEFVYAGAAAVIQTTTAAQTAALPVTSSPHTDTITCTVNTADGTAIAANGDYTPIVNGTVTFAPGQTSAVVPVAIPAGTSIQPNRAFTVSLSGCSTNVVVADPTGTVTINGVQPPSAPVVTTNPTSQSVKSGVPVTFAAAAAGSPTPTVQWMSEAPGATTFTAIPGATSPNYTFAPAFTQSGTKFEAVFTNTLGSATTTPATLTVTAGLSLALSPSSLSYGSVPDGVTETHNFTVTNTGSASLTISSSAPPTAGVGFTATSSIAAGTTLAAGASLIETVAFAPTTQGALSDSWSITASDGLGAHTLTLTGTGLAPLTPTVSINWINLVRPTTGTATATFTLSLSAPSPTTASVTVRTLDGTAKVANGDYVAITSKVVTFAPGQTTATVPVTVNGKVATHSYFGLQIVAPDAGVVVTNDYGRANLLGATDVAHEFVYGGTAAAVQTTTDAQTAQLPITSSAHTDTITCTVNTADGTATVANGDYVPIVNGTVTLAPGQTSVLVPLTISTGAADQPNRSFTVNIGTCSTNVVVADSVGTVNIIG